ncbi:MAG: site-specific integrase [Armatimonadota bacterium]|nr:site-specific integrase [bacterium]
MNIPTISNQSSPRLHWAAEQFLDFCRTKNLSTNALVFYRDRLKRFSKFCEVEPNINAPTSVTTADIRRFISSLADSGLSTKTVNHYIQALKAFFSFLVEEEAIEKNPAARVKPQKLVKRIIGTFSDEQISAMLSACDMHAFRGVRVLRGTDRNGFL